MDPDPATREAKGRRSLITTLFRFAETTPDRLFGSFPPTGDIEDGFRDITCADIAKAIDACAWFIKDTYGTSKSFEKLLYMGVNDYRYAIVEFAAQKCGFVAMFLSPRNPKWQNLMLLEKTECSKALYSAELAPVIKELQNERQCLDAVELASLTHWLDQLPDPFPYYKTWDESKWDPMLVLHSSGSTGPPKPIVLPNGYMSTVDHTYRKIDGREPILMNIYDFGDEGGFVFASFPAFHLGGNVAMTMSPILSFQCASIMAPPDTDPTQMAEVALRMMQLKPVKLTFFSPLLVDQVSKLPGGIEALGKLRSCNFTGGPLRQALGDELEARGVQMVSSFGSTEMGCIVSLSSIRGEGEWSWLNFHPDLNPSFEEIADGQFEMVLKDNDDPDRTALGSHWTFPEMKEFRSKDLFIPHPTKPGLWKYYGRTDDILVFSHGQKINPVPMEAVIQGEPKVRGALVAGVNRWPACLLVEPQEEVKSRDAFVKEIWPKVEEANELVQHWARVLPSMVLVLEPGGMVRAPKGTIVRKMNDEKYQAAIEQLYEDYEKGQHGRMTY